MKVKVIPALGGGEPTEVEVQETDNVGALKKRICEIKHVPPDVTRLTFRGKAPDESSTLKSLGVKEGDKFVLITRTIGG